MNVKQRRTTYGFRRGRGAGALRGIACICSITAFGAMLWVFLSAAWGAAGGYGDPGDSRSNSPMAHTIADEDRIDPADEIDPPQGFVLMFTGNWLAHLEPCGCSDRQLGGIDRRTRIFDLVAPNRRLLLDAGPLIVGWENGSLQRLFKLEAFLYSLGELDYDAITLTYSEMDAMQWELGVASTDRPELLATNLDEFALMEFEGISYLQKTLEVDGEFLDCLVLGVMDAGDADEFTLEDGTLEPPGQAVERVLYELGLELSELSLDTLVIVTYSGLDEEVLDELRWMPAVDMVVTHDYADEPEISTPVRREYEAVVVTTGHMGKYIAAISIPPGSGTQLDEFEFLPIAVEDDYVRDPAVVRYIDDYQLQLAVEDLIADESKLRRAGLADGNYFVGSSTCGQSGCHQEIYETWQEFSHARAMPTLIDINRDMDPECVACHVVGMEYVTGYRSMESTPDLAGVGCEMCHGPGLNHVLDVLAPYNKAFTSCEQCHTHETSPSFEPEREEYFEQINHWSGPRKWWW
ncbi:MAG: cytochrome c family protein [Sedimentisphaerales bacterium]|nr:cytochrome c family protein [Sedimentisphaerales bacterium]